jgi:hypothetical protein
MSTELFDFRGVMGCESETDIEYDDWKRGYIILCQDMKRGDGVQLQLDVEYTDMKTVVYTGIGQISHDCNLTSFIFPNPPRIFSVLYKGRCRIKTIGDSYIERIFTTNFIITNEIDYNFSTTIDRNLSRKLVVIDGVGKWIVYAVPGREPGRTAYSVSSVEYQPNPFPFNLKYGASVNIYSQTDLDAIPEFSRDLVRIGKTITTFRSGL